MLRNGSAAITAAAVLALAGCGSNSNKTLSYGAFVKQANAVCRKADATLKPLGNKITGEPKADVAVLTQIISKQEAATASFTALKPPSELKADFDKFNVLTASQTGRTKTALAVAKTGNKGGYIAVVKSLTPIGVQTDRVASKLGAKDCVGA